MAPSPPQNRLPATIAGSERPSTPGVISRRAAVRKMAAAAGFVGAAAAIPFSVLHGRHVESWLAGEPGSWSAQIFNPHQNELTIALVDLIIPETDTPGARQARVNEYIDVVLTQADFKDAYLSGLDWTDGFAKKRRGAPFLDLDPDRRRGLLEELSDEHEESPPELDEGRRFFDLIKRLTIHGYYTSEPGLLEELRYQGGDFLNEYPAACKHEGH